MAQYRYLLCDLLTDEVRAVLPLRGVSFDRRLCRVGSFTGSFTATTPAMVDTLRGVHGNTGRSALYVLRDGQVWWGGILWGCQVRQGQRDAVEGSLSAATFESYAHRRKLRADLTYSQVDQGHIMAGLWRHLQTDPRGDIGVIADDQDTGVLRDRTYFGADLAEYGKLLEDLGDVEGGAEHTIDVYADANGNRVKRLRVANRLGSATPTAVFNRARMGGGRLLEWGDNVDSVPGGTTFQARGDSAQGNVGAAAGPLLSTVHEATELLGQGWPLLDVTEDYSSVTDPATLEAHAAGLRERNSGALRSRGYIVQVGGSGWSPNSLGDTVRLKVADMWHTPPVDMQVRPVACQVTAPDRGSDETVELIFGED